MRSFAVTPRTPEFPARRSKPTHGRTKEDISGLDESVEKERAELIRVSAPRYTALASVAELPARRGLLPRRSSRGSVLKNN
jgi:hypothetical protein